MAGVVIPYLGPDGEHKGKIELIDINKKKTEPLKGEVGRLRERVTWLKGIVWGLVALNIATIAIVIHLVTK